MCSYLQVCLHLFINSYYCIRYSICVYYTVLLPETILTEAEIPRHHYSRPTLNFMKTLCAEHEEARQKFAGHIGPDFKWNFLTARSRGGEVFQVFPYRNINVIKWWCSFSTSLSVNGSVWSKATLITGSLGWPEGQGRVNKTCKSRTLFPIPLIYSNKANFQQFLIKWRFGTNYLSNIDYFFITCTK